MQIQQATDRQLHLVRTFNQDLVVSIGAIPFEERRDVSVPVGKTINEIIGIKLPEDHEILVMHKGEVILPEKWDEYIPTSDYPLYINVVPGKGFGSIFGLVASIALSVIAPGIGGFLGAQFGFGALGTRLLTGAIFAVGKLIVGKIFTPDPPQQKQIERDPQRYGIGGIQNQFPSRRDSVLYVMGTHRVSPYFATRPYSYAISTTQLGFRALYDVGIGPIEFDQTNFKFGDTVISSFQNVTVVTHEGIPGTDSEIAQFSDIHKQTNHNKELKQVEGWSTYAYVSGATRIDIIVQYNGLVEFTSSNDKGNRDVEIEVQRKQEGEANFSNVGTYTASGNTTSQYFQSISFAVAATGGEIRIRRNTMDNEGDDYNSSIQDKAFLGTIDQVTPNTPVVAQGRALVYIQLHADEELNNTIQNFNLVASRKVPTWDPVNGWSGRIESSNPAWIAADVLRGPGIAFPVPDADIDTPALLEMAQHADASSYEFNRVFNSFQSVWDTYATILGAARSTPALVDGSKYSVVIDREKTVPIDLITPRDSLQFSGQKAFTPVPDALRGVFNNRADDYRESEVIVYDTGKDAVNSTDVRTIDVRAVGITSVDEVHKYLRYSIAEAKLRPELFTIVMDVKNLRLKRGDYVDVVHDIPLIGLGAGRITALQTSGNMWRGFNLDEYIELQGGNAYSVRIQDLDGNAITQEVRAGRVPVIVPEREESRSVVGVLS